LSQNDAIEYLTLFGEITLDILVLSFRDVDDSVLLSLENLTVFSAGSDLCSKCDDIVLYLFESGFETVWQQV
jgi:hypothetical protein